MDERSKLIANIFGGDISLQRPPEAAHLEPVDQIGGVQFDLEGENTILLMFVD